MEESSIGRNIKVVLKKIHQSKSDTVNLGLLFLVH